MRLSGTLTLFGASIVALGIMLTSAEAKTVHSQTSIHRQAHSHPQKARRAERRKHAAATKTTRADAKDRHREQLPKELASAPVNSDEGARASSLAQEPPRLTGALALPAASEIPTGLLNAQKAPNQKVKSVTYDLASGIKTTLMTDGSIAEEPIGDGITSKLMPEDDDPQSLAAFVKQVRKVSFTAGPSGAENQVNGAGVQ